MLRQPLARAHQSLSLVPSLVTDIGFIRGHAHGQGIFPEIVRARSAVRLVPNHNERLTETLSRYIRPMIGVRSLWTSSQLRPHDNTSLHFSNEFGGRRLPVSASAWPKVRSGFYLREDRFHFGVGGTSALSGSLSLFATGRLSMLLNPLIHKNTPLLPMSVIQKRNVINCSLRKGKKKTVKAVIKRFYRLNWGIWIRTRSGRDKHLWKKSSSRIRRGRQHVFVSGSQTNMLDGMVSKFWLKPKYWVNDPYEPYHKREEFWVTRRKPV